MKKSDVFLDAAKVAALLSLVFIAFSCGQLTLIGPGNPSVYGGKLELNIEPGAGFNVRGITSQEFEVTALDVSITCLASETEVFALNWVPGDETTYLIDLDEEGEYEVVVLHQGAENGQTVQLVESLVVDIVRMKITTITIIPGFVAQVIIDSGTVYTATVIEVYGNTIEYGEGPWGARLENTYVLDVTDQILYIVPNDEIEPITGELLTDRVSLYTCDQETGARGAYTRTDGGNGSPNLLGHTVAFFDSFAEADASPLWHTR
jgi:hypothetical protein